MNMDGFDQWLPDQHVDLRRWPPPLPYEKNITTTFFKCTRWEVEEAAGDLVADCRYHYSCTSSYSGDYPPLVDFSVAFFALASFASAAFFTLLELRRGGSASSRRRSALYLLPSGQIGLPAMLVVLAKGFRVNTIFPLTHFAPLLFQLVLVSALAFENQVEHLVNYALLEASTISGVLHAAVYLDAIVMPYYTGLEAMSGPASTLSGECPSCVCRREALLAGGGVEYRGWSSSVWLVAFVLCSRAMRRINAKAKAAALAGLTVEAAGWVSIARDSVYLMSSAMAEAMGNGDRRGEALVASAGYGGICAMVLLNAMRKMRPLWVVWLSRAASSRRRAIGVVDSGSDSAAEIV